MSDSKPESRLDERLIRQRLLKIARDREEGKTFCPSEVARSLATNENQWRALMPRVRRCAHIEEAKGRIRATQGGRWIAMSTAKGPIRFLLHRDDRDPNTPCIELLNLGSVVANELKSNDIHTLNDLRKAGAINAFESVMIARLHRGERKGIFHTMYLYALFGALHNENCMKLPQSIRAYLKAEASQLRVDIIGED